MVLGLLGVGMALQTLKRILMEGGQLRIEVVDGLHRVILAHTHCESRAGVKMLVLLMTYGPSKETHYYANGG